MPYKRKYKTTRSGHRFARRRGAASTLQAAWRRRKRRQRGSLLQRQALSNRRGIKAINRKIETKYATSHVAQDTNNYTGQQLTLHGLDCTGFPNQLAGVIAWNTATQGTINPVWSSNSVVMRPICVENGVGEQQRLGEDIHMTWLNIKGQVTAYSSGINGTSNVNTVNWQDSPRHQKVRIVVVLDTQPVGWKALAPPAFQPEYQPGYLYNNTGVIANFPAFPTTLTRPNKEYLRGLSKAPFGSYGADTSVDPWSQSYYENNFVQSRHGNKTARFKVLKTLVLTVTQPYLGGMSGRQGPSRKNFSMTIKAPYRFHFPDNTTTVPDNQEILVFMASDVKMTSPTNHTDITPPICTPKVHIQCKLAFKDA